MTATIEIDGLRLYAHHGVMEQERELGNLFEVSASLRYPALVATVSDEVNHTLNYADVINVIRSEMSQPSLLLENAAGRIVKSLRHRFPLIEGGKLSLRKLTPPCGAELNWVGVTLEW